MSSYFSIITVTDKILVKLPVDPIFFVELSTKKDRNISVNKPGRLKEWRDYG